MRFRLPEPDEIQRRILVEQAVEALEEHLAVPGIRRVRIDLEAQAGAQAALSRVVERIAQDVLLDLHHAVGVRGDPRRGRAEEIGVEELVRAPGERPRPAWDACPSWGSRVLRSRAPHRIWPPSGYAANGSSS